MSTRVRIALASVAGTMVFGTLTFRILFHDRWLLSAYLTLATMSTVGAAQVHPRNDWQLLLIGTLIVIGAAAWIFSLSLLVSHFLESDLGYFRERRLRMEISRQKNHFVVVGAGRVGTSLARELVDHGEHVVVVDTAADRIARIKEVGLTGLVLRGLTTESFQDTHIDAAKGLALALADDAQNLYAYLATRALNPHLQVVARAQTIESAEYLRSLGIERIILPEVVGGRRMARMLTKPVAHDLLMALLNEEGALVSEIPVASSSSIANQPVKRVRDVYGDDYTLIGYWRADSFRMAPKATDIILPDDTLILIQAVSSPDPD